jgi:hypothetical protein
MVIAAVINIWSSEFKCGNVRNVGNVEMWKCGNVMNVVNACPSVWTGDDRINEINRGKE